MNLWVYTYRRHWLNLEYIRKIERPDNKGVHNVWWLGSDRPDKIKLTSGDLRKIRDMLTMARLEQQYRPIAHGTTDRPPDFPNPIPKFWPDRIDGKGRIQKPDGDRTGGDADVGG